MDARSSRACSDTRVEAASAARVPTATQREPAAIEPRHAAPSPREPRANRARAAKPAAEGASGARTRVPAVGRAMSLGRVPRSAASSVTPNRAARTPESAPSQRLHFVVHKHHASHLHYDHRLEVRRRAALVGASEGHRSTRPSSASRCWSRDHRSGTAPSRGTDPREQYGGGTMMTVGPRHCGAEDPAVRRDIARGELKFDLRGGEAAGLVGAGLHRRTRRPRPALVAAHQRDGPPSDEDVTGPAYSRRDRPPAGADRARQGAATSPKPR